MVLYGSSASRRYKGIHDDIAGQNWGSIRHNPLEGVLLPLSPPWLLGGSSAPPPSYSVRWHFLNSHSHVVSRTISRMTVRSIPNDSKIITWYKSRNAQIKIIIHTVAYGVKREIPPNKFISQYKWKYTQIHNLEHYVHICWGILALQLLPATA